MSVAVSYQACIRVLVSSEWTGRVISKRYFLIFSGQSTASNLPRLTGWASSLTEFTLKVQLFSSYRLLIFHRPRRNQAITRAWRSSIKLACLQAFHLWSLLSKFSLLSRWCSNRWECCCRYLTLQISILWALRKCLHSNTVMSQSFLNKL